MRISCHTITWGQEHLETAVKEISQLGFHYFETFASVADDFANDNDAFRKLIGTHGLELVALYGGGDMHRPEKFDQVVEHNLHIARFLEKNGANRLVLGPARRPPDGPTREDLDHLVACANEIGWRTRDHGVLACLHPHVYTVVETIDEIDYVFEHLDPELVGLAADTAHFAKGNSEVPGAETLLFNRYSNRIEYVHLKDWDPNLPPELTGEGGTAVIRDFTELGQGNVDLKGCVDILRSVNYEGWLTIELDYTRKTPLESVRMSKEYLEQALGLSA